MLHAAETNKTGLAGAVIEGATFLPAGDEAVYAVFRLNNLSVGVTVESAKACDYLRLTPSIQIPPEGREGFEEWQFECDDDGMVDLSFDARDGEITMRVDLDELSAEAVELPLRMALLWLDEAMYPQVMGYIRSVFTHEFEA